VVLKAVLPGVLHKSDVGVVATGLGSMDATRNAANVMTSTIAEDMITEALRGYGIKFPQTILCPTAEQP
ncbi:acetate--CoA ligase family protein, partial [Rhizobium ruizarguesonis]